MIKLWLLSGGVLILLKMCAEEIIWSIKKEIYSSWKKNKLIFPPFLQLEKFRHEEELSPGERAEVGDLEGCLPPAFLQSWCEGRNNFAFKMGVLSKVNITFIDF